jgi:CBS domain-containing protein
MLLLITQGQAGAISVVGKGNALKGLVSDYDIRKGVGAGRCDLRPEDSRPDEHEADVYL